MMHGAEDSWHWGLGFGHFGLGLFFWIVLILLIAAMLKYLFGKKK